MINLDEVTELNDSSIFRLERDKIWLSYSEKELLLGFSIQMNLDQILIGRTGYTILDVLSDVGGLQSILISGISLLLSILNHNFLDSYLVSKLFNFSQDPVGPSTSSSSKMKRIKLYCISKLLPKYLLCCCQKQRKQIAMERAYATLKQEMDVIELIRARRFTYMALKHLLDPPKYQEIKARSLLAEIEIDKKSPDASERQDPSSILH